MFTKLIFKNHINFFKLTTNKLIKKNLCNGVSAQNVTHNYKYLLILDFEATCDAERREKQEIIEFPCLKININNFEEESRFHHYVRPVLYPTLSDFCIELTGILQETVNDAKIFPEVYELFENWRREENLTEENSLYITSGDWDLGHMMPKQCEISNLVVPSHMKIWTDIKKLFGYNNEKFYSSFTDIMRYYNFTFKGRKHSGIDDCLNILQVVKQMGEFGIPFKPTSRLVTDKIEVINARIKKDVNTLTGPKIISGKYFRKRHKRSKNLDTVRYNKGMAAFKNNLKF